MLLGLGAWAGPAGAQGSKPTTFRVIAFFTGRHDLAHLDFVREANQWFPQQAAQHGFTYDTTSNWQNMNAGFLARYQVVVFLDTRPEEPDAAGRVSGLYGWRRGVAGLPTLRAGVRAYALGLSAELGLVPQPV